MEEMCMARLNPADMLRLRLKLGELNMTSTLEDIFWLPVPPALLNAEQRRHMKSCGPYFLALELDTESGELRLEALVRAEKCLHCTCIAMAEPTLLGHMQAQVEELLRGLNITNLNNWTKCQA